MVGGIFLLGAGKEAEDPVCNWIIMSSEKLFSQYLLSFRCILLPALFVPSSFLTLSISLSDQTFTAPLAL